MSRLVLGAIDVEPVAVMRPRNVMPSPYVRSPTSSSTSTEVRSPTRSSTEVRSPTSTSTEVRSPTSTSTEVRSPTSTSTDAYTQGNVTVTGGAGAGATTTVYIRGPQPSQMRRADESAHLFRSQGAALRPERQMRETGAPRPAFPSLMRETGAPRPASRLVLGDFSGSRSDMSEVSAYCKKQPGSHADDCTNFYLTNKTGQYSPPWYEGLLGATANIFAGSVTAMQQAGVTTAQAQLLASQQAAARSRRNQMLVIGGIGVLGLVYFMRR